MFILIIGGVIAAAVAGSVIYISRRKKVEQPLPGQPPIKKKSVYGFRDRIEYLKETNPYYKEVKSSLDKKYKKGIEKGPIKDET